MDRLPYEILGLISEYLDIQDRASLRAVDRCLRAALPPTEWAVVYTDKTVYYKNGLRHRKGGKAAFIVPGKVLEWYYEG